MAQLHLEVHAQSPFCNQEFSQIQNIYGFYTLMERRLLLPQSENLNNQNFRSFIQTINAVKRGFFAILRVSWLRILFEKLIRLR